jgi:hypothetical protein
MSAPRRVHRFRGAVAATIEVTGIAAPWRRKDLQRRLKLWVYGQTYALARLHRADVVARARRRSYGPRPMQSHAARMRTTSSRVHSTKAEVV